LLIREAIRVRLDGVEYRITDVAIRARAAAVGANGTISVHVCVDPGLHCRADHGVNLVFVIEFRKFASVHLFSPVVGVVWLI
jgi:hypothetical protein